MGFDEVIARLDWVQLRAQLDREGFATVPAMLSDGQIRALATDPDWPAWVAELQRAFHPQLVPIANRWNEALGRPLRHSGTPGAFHGSQAILSHLRAGEDQPLHDRSADAQGFALQLVALLGEPGEDFTGGAFVMTEQRPRMQSRPVVVPLRRGDVAVIAVAQRPRSGSNGTYAVHLRHGIGRVRGGGRLGLELLFSVVKDQGWPEP
ncbi:2OG-Fe(II) oxygenase [Variovorax sp. LT1R16]|uniref:2OG-Fe(II) oxygenase n=1 Tax=Variovorax sp. LT1R16 TaxID=3443728 RepID=UPI003F47828B